MARPHASSPSRAIDIGIKIIDIFGKTKIDRKENRVSRFMCQTTEWKRE